MSKKYDFLKKAELIITTLERARLNMIDFAIHADDFDIRECSENLKQAIDDFIEASVKYTI